MPGLIEYLYVDERRLDSYVEQIGPPIKYDKIPLWSAELSLTGPRASGSQHQHARPWTTHEKIQLLVKHLCSSRQIVKGAPRGSGDDIGPQFGVLISDAFPVLLPPHESKPNFGGLRLWVSWHRHISRSDWYLTCLIEDDRAPDQPYSPGALSPFSTLGALLRAGTLSGIGDTILVDEANSEVFDSAPGERLRELGGAVGSERKVTALFRVRSRGVKPIRAHARVVHTVIGYPIFIAEGELPGLENLPRAADVHLE
jgi:hypothetical protein